MNAWPQVTFFSGGTEAPDETAQGEWLNLVAKAGFSYLMANVKYLRDGEYDLERIEEAAPAKRVRERAPMRVGVGIARAPVDPSQCVDHRQRPDHDPVGQRRARRADGVDGLLVSCTATRRS